MPVANFKLEDYIANLLKDMNLTEGSEEYKSLINYQFNRLQSKSN